MIITGDFNIDLLAHSQHLETNNFLNLMQVFNYLPTITRPTRFPEGEQQGSPSLLDHIYLNFYPPSISGILHYKVTDHLPVFINIVIPKEANELNKINFRTFNDDNKANFTRDLASIDFDRLLSLENDLNTNFNLFFDKIGELYDLHFPIKTKTLTTKRLENKWLTNGLMTSIKNKNRLFKQFRLGNTTEAIYKSYRNRLTSLIRASKKNYYNNLFSNNKNDMKKLWKNVNLLTNNKTSNTKVNSIILKDKVLSQPQAISDAFNNYFSNIASDLEVKLPPSENDYMQYMRGDFPHSIAIPETSPNDLLKIINSLKNKSCNVDDISVYIIKQNALLFARPLSFLFNQSVNTGTFPERLKHARITPIYKKGSKSDLNNYRPISNLNILSKIFEKTMKVYLVDFISKYNIINPKQFGFQKNKSTEDALINFSEHLYSQLDNSKSTLSIFIDFSKAFDTVPHNILLEKLKYYGIRGIILDWFADYLKSRSQHTIFENCASQSSLLSLGVPQGSVLGPILFLIFINDLPHVSDFFSTYLFADDANLSASGDDATLLINRANFELFKYNNWFISNRLTINILKTYYVLFANRRPAELPVLALKSNYTYEVIKRVTSIKFLGVYYDDKLHFKEQCNFLSNKLSRISALIYRIKDLVPTFVLKLMYESHVNSVLSYCNVIWSHTYQTHLDQIRKLLKRIIRNATHSEFLAPSAPLFKELNVLNFDGMSKYALGCYVFKNKDALHNLYIPAHRYNTRRNNLLRLPSHKTDIFTKSFIYQAPIMYNFIANNCPNILESPHLFSFKRQFKKFLLSS